MPVNKPIYQKQSPAFARSSTNRALISPCTGCKNNIPVEKSVEWFEAMSKLGVVPGGNPCPKKLLYAEKAISGDQNRLVTIGHPAFNEDMRGVNPVFYNATDEYGNKYAYCYVAKISDNVDTGANPSFDTENIICAGPYLIEEPEKVLNMTGNPEQLDVVIVTEDIEIVDGIEFKGYVRLAGVYHNNLGYAKQRDKIPAKALAGSSGI